MVGVPPLLTAGSYPPISSHGELKPTCVEAISVPSGSSFHGQRAVKKQKECSVAAKRSGFGLQSLNTPFRCAWRELSVPPWQFISGRAVTFRYPAVQFQRENKGLGSSNRQQKHAPDANPIYLLPLLF